MNIDDLVLHLPERDPRPDLWNRIAADLDADERIDRALGDLPQREPKADLWAAIEGELDQTKAVPVTAQLTAQPVVHRPRSSPFTVVRPLWAGLAAAAIVILVGTWLFIRPVSTTDERIEYAVEPSAGPTTFAVETPTVDTGTSPADERAEEFIARQCAEEQLVCQRPEVHELRTQLVELNAERDRIFYEINTFGNDPTLIRAQVKVENQRADVTKELITLLRS